MSSYENVQMAVKTIRRHISNFSPKVGIILGSGLGSLANDIVNPIIIPYNKIPGFHSGNVHGHAHQLICGTLCDVPVICYQGRAHMYEGVHAETIKIMVRTLKELGCKSLFMTAAVGAILPEAAPGSLVLIRDHIRFQPDPLFGPNDDEFGPRFTSLSNAYDREYRERMLVIARELKMKLPEGVYCAVTGPSYETAAEIRAFRTLGADVVGMSIAPEAIIARHCGLKVMAFAVVTNWAEGLTDEEPDHNKVVEWAESAAGDVTKLFKTFLKKHAHEF